MASQPSSAPTTADKPKSPLPRVAIVGTGISGLTAAYYLHRHYDISVFEADSRIGGHTATIDVEHRGQSLAIDTGFIVFNDWTYPKFKHLLAEIGVEYQPTSMGFSVSCRQSGFEYSGNNLDGFFAQKKRLLSPRHWQLLLDIVRFNRESQQLLAEGKLDDDQTLADLLKALGLNQAFADHYLLPMTSAIWSKSRQASLAMPARFFVAFFKNHGLLSLSHRPQWHVIRGGSRAYLEPLTKTFSDRIYTNSAVSHVERSPNAVHLTVNGEVQVFDQVIFACHSDQALKSLADPSLAEKQVLGAIDYQANDVVLHWDETLLPRNRKCWSSWNYLKDGSLSGGDNDRAVLTYNMNILQGFDLPTNYCVTLNHTKAIDERKILGQFQYAHPQFTREGIAAQGRWDEVNGVNRTWFCGAWWGNGFHEDGVASACRVVEGLQQSAMQSAQYSTQQPTNQSQPDQVASRVAS